MDCLRSFTLTSSGTSDTAIITTSNVIDWQDRYNRMTGFNATINLNTGTQFFPQGFKNINLFGVRVNGMISTANSAAGGYGVVNQWKVNLSVLGQRQILGGTIPAVTPSTPVSWNQTSSGIFFSNTCNYLDLPSPIQSVSQISWETLQIEGFAPTLLAGVVDFSFDYAFNFTFYYRFEGE